MGYSMNLLIIAVEEAVFLQMCCGQTLLDELHSRFGYRFSSQVLPLSIIPRKKDSIELFASHVLFQMVMKHSGGSNLSINP